MAQEEIHTLTTILPIVGQPIEVKDATAMRAVEGCVIVQSDTVSHIVPLTNVYRATQVIVKD